MIYSDKVPLAEPVVVPDIFVSGLARIEAIGGGNLRFTFFTNQRSTMYADERVEHVVVLRLVMHLEAVKDGQEATAIAVEGVQGIVRDIIVEKRH